MLGDKSIKHDGIYQGRILERKPIYGYCQDTLMPLYERQSMSHTLAMIIIYIFFFMFIHTL